MARRRRVRRLGHRHGGVRPPFWPAGDFPDTTVGLRGYPVGYWRSVRWAVLTRLVLVYGLGLFAVMVAVALIASALTYSGWGGLRFMGLYVLGAAAHLVAIALLLSVLVPDAQDRLSRRERAISAPVLDTAPVCDLPLGRVLDASVDLRSRPKRIRYRCGWTIFGFAGSTTTAECVGGEWLYPGWLEPWHTGEC